MSRIAMDSMVLEHVEAFVGLKNSPAQRSQYPLIKEYALNHNIKASII